MATENTENTETPTCFDRAAAGRGSVLSVFSVFSVAK